MSSAAAEMMKRQVEEVREAEEKDEEKPEMSEDEREKYYRRRRGLGIGYLPGHGFYISSHAPRSLTVPVIFLLALVLVFYFGLTIDLFIMIFVIVGIVCLGKVGGAADYCRKIKKYRLNAPEGALIVKKLVSAQTCFTAIILAFTVVETLRSIFDIELTAVVEWALWISWFSGIILVGAALLRLLARWGSFQSSRKFKETCQKIMFREGHGYKQAYAS